MTVEQTLEMEMAVPPGQAGRRVDQIAAVLFTDYSRALLKVWIEEGALRVDGRAVKPKTRLFGGETLRLRAALVAREDWQTAQSVPFGIIYEDSDLLVIDKPAGVVVHPGAGNRDQTLVNGLLQYRPELALLARAGIVHRLDKDTSGLLLVAGTLPAQKALTQMLAQRRLDRRYIAVTEGVVIAGRDIDLPLGRHPRQRTRQAVREGGRESLTKLQPLERYRSHSLVEAKLATGRTHQIRVHLSAIGHPLVGDRRYGARGIVPNRAGSMLVDCLRYFPRQALHARVLELDHPVTGRPLSFRSPIPADINTLLGLLRDDTAVPDET